MGRIDSFYWWSQFVSEIGKSDMTVHLKNNLTLSHPKIDSGSALKFQLMITYLLNVLRNEFLNIGFLL